MKSQVIIVTVTLFSYVCATNYKWLYGGLGEKAVGSRHRRDAKGGSEGRKNNPYMLCHTTSNYSYNRPGGGDTNDYVIELRDEIMMQDKIIRSRLRNDWSASTFLGMIGAAAGAISSFLRQYHVIELRDKTGAKLKYPRKPHRIDYTVDDGQGNSHFRHEYSDEFGNVNGSYGYTNARGLYRVVEYVADARGFRANVKSNEPGASNVRIMPTMPETLPSGYGAGSNSPSASQLTNAVKYGTCDTGENFDAEACSVNFGSG